MTSRDVWSHASTTQLPDLLGSALLMLLLDVPDERPVYFSSPWMSDFGLLDNHFRQVVPLFPDAAERGSIPFSEYLRTLAYLRPIRIITTDTAASRTFLNGAWLRFGSERITARFAGPQYHEKGILAPMFYFEGSMNITHSGVHVRDEKVTYHAGTDAIVANKIARAYLEFDRRWNALPPLGMVPT